MYGLKPNNPSENVLADAIYFNQYRNVPDIKEGIFADLTHFS